MIFIPMIIKDKKLPFCICQKLIIKSSKAVYLIININKNINKTDKKSLVSTMKDEHNFKMAYCTKIT